MYFLCFVETGRNGELEEHRDWGVADSVLSWVIKVPLLAYLFYTAVSDLDNGIHQVDSPAPPPTADRM